MSTSVSSLFSSGEIKAIVSQLEARLQAPITVEQSEIKTDQAQISAIGQVQGALTSLNGALSKLADPASLDAMQATVTGSAATASAAASAPSGAYDLTNIKLAKAQEVYSSTYASASAQVGSGSGALTFKFTGGSSAKINIPSSADTVQGIAKAINAAGAGVTATVIQTSTGVHLGLQSTTSGATNAFSVSGSGAVSSLSYSASGSGSTLTLAQAARDASFDLNGEPITEPSNGSIKLLQGLTINLTSSGSAAVSVAKSSQSLSSALSTLTTQFNNAVSLIAKQTQYKAAKSSASGGSASAKPQIGPLLGNVQVEQLQQSLLSGISSAAASGLSANAIGLTVSSGGQVSFDSATFGSEYAKNPAAVNTLVQGMVKAIQGVVSGAVGSAGTTPSAGTAATPATINSGFLQSASTSLQASVTSINQEIVQQQKIELSQVSLLEQQFVAAETSTGSANTTLAYIGALLNSSSGTGSKG